MATEEEELNPNSSNSVRPSIERTRKAELGEITVSVNLISGRSWQSVYPAATKFGKVCQDIAECMNAYQDSFRLLFVLADWAEAESSENDRTLREISANSNLIILQYVQRNVDLDLHQELVEKMDWMGPGQKRQQLQASIRSLEKKMGIYSEPLTSHFVVRTVDDTLTQDYYVASASCDISNSPRTSVEQKENYADKLNDPSPGNPEIRDSQVQVEHMTSVNINTSSGFLDAQQLAIEGRPIKIRTADLLRYLENHTDITHTDRNLWDAKWAEALPAGKAYFKAKFHHSTKETLSDLVAALYDRPSSKYFTSWWIEDLIGPPAETMTATKTNPWGQLHKDTVYASWPDVAWEHVVVLWLPLKNKHMLVGIRDDGREALSKAPETFLASDDDDEDFQENSPPYVVMWLGARQPHVGVRKTDGEAFSASHEFVLSAATEP